VVGGRRGWRGESQVARGGGRVEEDKRRRTSVSWTGGERRLEEDENGGGRALPRRSCNRGGPFSICQLLPQLYLPSTPDSLNLFVFICVWSGVLLDL
jgi:hypothetical protein